MYVPYLLAHALPSIVGVLCVGLAQAQGLQSLEEEKKRLEAEAAVEKLKADIADSKRKQREAEALLELGIRQKEAEARKAQAEAERGEALAKVPPTKIEALPGVVDVKNFGAAGLVVAVDLARDLASLLCAETAVAKNAKVVIYDTGTAGNVVAARLLETQLDLYRRTLKKALQQKDDGVAQVFGLGIGFDAVIATGTIKAFADLASLFKTNVTATKTDFAEAKSVLATAMAAACPATLVGLPAGYLGELDPKPMEELRGKSVELLEDRFKLEERIEALKKSIEQEKDEPKRKQLQNWLNELQAVGKQVDAFLSVLKPNDVSDKSPLAMAARFLAYSKRIDGAKVLDVDIKLEGLTIIRENIFTGQRLRLSATAILWYRLHEPDGSIAKAAVIRRIAKPIQVNLRGYNAPDDFWTKQ